MTDLDALMEYFRQSSTDYAYMITGPWGCGKSYFWNRVAMPAIAKDSTWDVEHKPIPIYISLYGIKDLDEISRSVLLQIHPKLGITGKAISVLGRGIAQYFNLDELAEKIDVVQWLEPLAKKKNLIICFDDLERAPRPVSRVLGFINQYVEQLGMKTVILCNEQEIFDRKGGESYRKTKEKVIRITRQFSGNHSEAIDAIIQESTSRKGYHAYLRKHRDENKTIFEYSGLQNLRILKFGLNVLELAYHYAKELAPRNEKLLSGLPSSLLPVTFEFQSGNLTDEQARQILSGGNRLFFGELFAGSKGNEDEPSPIGRFIAKYKIGTSSSNFAASAALADLVVAGYLNKHDFEAELSAQNTRKTATHRAAFRFSREWYILSDEEFGKTISLALESMRNGEMSDWDELLRVMWAAETCNGYDFLATPIEEFRKAFSDGVKVLCEQNRFVRLDQWQAQHAGEFGRESDSRPVFEWAKRELIRVNAELAFIGQKDAVQKAFERLDSDPRALWSLMVESKGHGFGNALIARFLKPAEFERKIGGASAKSRCQMVFAIRERYSESSNLNVRALVGDAEWLSDMLSRIDGLLAKAPLRTPGTYWLRTIRAEMEKAIATLKSLSPISKD